MKVETTPVFSVSAIPIETPETTTVIKSGWTFVGLIDFTKTETTTKPAFISSEKPNSLKINHKLNGKY